MRRRSNLIWFDSFGGDIVTNNPVGFRPFDIYYNPLTPYERIVHTDTAGNITEWRTSFRQHAFAVLNGNVYDACAGPITGNLLLTYFGVIDFEANKQYNQKHATAISLGLRAKQPEKAADVPNTTYSITTLS